MQIADFGINSSDVTGALAVACAAWLGAALGISAGLLIVWIGWRHCRCAINPDEVEPEDLAGHNDGRE
jgi:hypothetical protein